MGSQLLAEQSDVRVLSQVNEVASQHDKDANTVKEMETEITILQLLDHPNLSLATTQV